MKRKHMETREKLTIVICSCDAYEDLWYPYFTLFQKQWKDCPYPIVLNTESKSYKHEGLDIRCLQLYSDGVKGAEWSDRMIETLKRIDTEYILITCDDHFIVSPVNQNEFEEAFQIIKDNKHISTLSFVPHVPCNEKTKWIGNFGLWKMNQYFRVNLDTAIWRKKALLRHLRRGENIWEFEVQGTERALWDFTEYYKYKVGAKPIIDAPFHQRRGYGVVKGKWCWRTPELFEHFGISVDYTVRGLMTKEECIGQVEKDNAGDLEFEKQIINHRFKNFCFQAKRRIPIKLRIFLSKIKQTFKRCLKIKNS